MVKYEDLPILSLSPEQTILCTDVLPEITHLDDPALAVMMDFIQTPPHTIGTEDPIDDALNEMKVHGVHLLFVVDKKDRIKGLIASEDILGELPIKITQERRIPRSNILTKMIMLPLEKIIAFNIGVVDQAKVGNIVNTLKAHGRHYALVIKPKGNNQQIVRGIFTTSHISRQLHMDIANSIAKAQSLSELQKQHED